LTAALLLALLTIGAPPCQEGVAHEWQVLYGNGAVESYTSASGELEFEERPGWRWAARSRPTGTVVWSEWTWWHPAECSATDDDFRIPQLDQCP